MAANHSIDDSMNTNSCTLHSPSAIVHLEYELDSPPLRPGSGWTRFVCISDTHSRHFAVPDGDVLLHSGDLTNLGTCDDFRTTVQWLSGLPHPQKLIIAGNHDLPLDENDDWYGKNWARWHRTARQDRDAIMELLCGDMASDAGIHYIEDQTYEFCTKEHGRKWSVYGSPWSPWFHNWAFNYERGEHAERLVASFPKADILLTHGPPYGIFDTTVMNERVGCEALMSRVAKLRPRLHVFGHIHEAHGALIHEWHSEGEAEHRAEHTAFVNAANWPMGPRARRKERLAFGEAPFQPVIVDLLDDA